MMLIADVERLMRFKCMFRMQNILLNIGVAAVLVFTLLICFAYFQKGLGQSDKHVFLLKAPYLIALDHVTFENPDFFHRATLLTSQALTLKSTIRQFSKSITALTTSVPNHIPSQDIIYLSQGHNLIEISSNQDRIFNLEQKIKDPVIALSRHPYKSKVYALTDSNELYEIQFDGKKYKDIDVHLLGKLDQIPKDLLPQEMWTNPITSHLVIGMTKNNDSVLIEFDPDHLQTEAKTLALPGMIVKAGFYVSKDLLVVLDNKYRLHVIDSEKEMIIGNYYPNQYFQDTHLFSKPPQGFGFTKDYCYLVDETGALHQLSWKPNPQAILINRDIKIVKDNVIIQWKSPEPNPSALYLADLSLTTPRRIIATPNHHIQVPLDRMEAIKSKSFDVSLLSIHKVSGKIISPAVQFTLERGNE